MNYNLLKLKAKIKGLAIESQRLNIRISKSKTELRAKLRLIKHQLGADARYHLLAYGALRNIPYKIIEKNSNPHLKVYLNQSYLIQLVQNHCDKWQDKLSWTPKRLQDWLEAV